MPSASRPPIADSAGLPSKLAGVRVLLAEDNPTNQTVAMKMLHRLGCATEVVGDGLEVLAKLAEADFDIILMDVAMPRMDGFQATEEIRRLEQSQATTRHVPIIAMTAHAMQGDRERCLAAQMNDYLSKPVSLAQLAEVLERWARPIAAGQPSPSTADAVSEPPPVPPLQLARLHELSLGDGDFERELLDCLLADVDLGIDRLAAALAPLDPVQVANTLHGLVGACRTVGAEALGTLCRQREVESGQEDFAPGPAWLAAIKAERDHLSDAVAAHLARGADHTSVPRSDRSDRIGESN